MRAYTEGKNPTMDEVAGGRVKYIGGRWYWTEWHVVYTQVVCTADNFVTREDAEAHFAARLADLRGGWGHGGGRFTETAVDLPDGGKAIRFRSVRKNGKPGTLTGQLSMTRIRGW